MKLRSKKTGEIVDVESMGHANSITLSWQIDGHLNTIETYDSLAKLNEEWEDYEEPKVGYIIDPMEEDCLSVDDSGYEESDVERAKELGIWFETEEEAKRAVEKLKAFKRLEDKGFRFKDYTRKFDGFKRVDGSVFITAELDDEGVIGMIDDLNICFGGEE